MEKTVSDHLLDALDDLGSENLRRFRSKLCDRRAEPRVRRAAEERAKCNTELVELLISTFTFSGALQVTEETLRNIGCNQTAEDLRRSAEQHWPVSQPQVQDNAVPARQGSGRAPGPQQEGYDQPDSPLTLIPSGLHFKQTVMKEKGHNVYPVLDKGVRKRLALLINNVEFGQKDKRRNGAEKDEENMENLLRGLGYDVVKHTNLSGQEMDEAVKSFAGRSEHEDSDSTFVVIMSHGKSEKILGVHYGPDNQTDFLLVDRIFTHLNTENCPALLNKPKVILIQACRGVESGEVWFADSEDLWDSDAWENKEKNFICLRSSTPDTKSYRHKIYGSLFIIFLVEVFNANAHKDHIEELFRQVMVRIEKQVLPKQMVCKDRTTLLKNFYLFPGL